MKVPGTPRHPHLRRGSIDNGIVRSPTMLTVADRNGDGEPESMFAINDKSIVEITLNLYHSYSMFLFFVNSLI